MSFIPDVMTWQEFYRNLCFTAETRPELEKAAQILISEIYDQLSSQERFDARTDAQIASIGIPANL